MKAKVKRAILNMKEGQIAIVEYNKEDHLRIRRVVRIARDKSQAVELVDQCEIKDGYSFGFIEKSEGEDYKVLTIQEVIIEAALEIHKRQE